MRRGRVIRRALGLAGGALLLAALGLLAWAATVDLPEAALDPSNIASVQLTDRDGALLREVLSREDGRSVWVPLSRISPHLVQATLAGEDQRFYQHGGVDLQAMLRAAGQAARSGEVVSGASTVTMQLARLVSGVPRTVPGKLRQMVLALRLEGRLSKDKILWQYLNRAPYGNGTFGVEAAARRYFGRTAARLSLAQAALLAALPRAPSAYNPFRHRQRLQRRQRYLLSQMQHQGRISAAQARMARREQVESPFPVGRLSCVVPDLADHGPVDEEHDGLNPRVLGVRPRGVFFLLGHGARDGPADLPGERQQDLLSLPIVEHGRLRGVGRRAANPPRLQRQLSVKVEHAPAELVIWCSLALRPPGRHPSDSCRFQMRHECTPVR